MKAIRELETVVNVFDPVQRAEAFKSWADRYVAQLGVAQSVTDAELQAAVDRAKAVQIVRSFQVASLGHEILANPGLAHLYETVSETVSLVERAHTFIAYVTLLRAEPKAQDAQEGPQQPRGEAQTPSPDSPPSPDPNAAPAGS